MDTIYLDHNATTPTRPEVAEAMARCYAEGYANPASQHRPGQRARQVLEDARETTAEILGADLCASPPDRLVFTSGGTEANSWAVVGMARARGDGKPGQAIVSAIEHASVIEPAEHLMEQGWRLDLLGVTSDGVVRTDRLAELITPQARLVSVMLGNHETGVLQPVSELAPICHAAGVPLHTDAVQVAGKLPIDFRRLGVSAMTVAAHKFQGPLGIGALVLRHGAPIEPILFGGHQQEALRPGTEPVALACGMRTALELWQKEHEAHARRLTALRDRFETGLKAGFPEVVVNGSGAARLPHTSSIAFPGLDAQVLLVALDVSGVACSVGSACSSGSTELSPTLQAMQLPHEIVAGSLRFSLGATTTEAEIDEAVRRIVRVVGEMRG
ncbi:MAG TPA: cysteine desulfurase family protein [Thermoguttaceae bacterium]|nr:cysteine desulfurase family protein [Thermoguttaceae bacterium]